jgi:hypothetical protein
MCPMKGARVDPVCRVVRAQAGLTWGEVDGEGGEAIDRTSENRSSPSSRDGGAANLGEAGAKTTEPSGQEPSRPKALSQDTPPKPFPGQLTPDAKGQCPGRTQIPINGGCWLELSIRDAEACEEGGMIFFKDRCYAPAMSSRRKPPPTSAPPDFR